VHNITGTFSQAPKFDGSDDSPVRFSEAFDVRSPMPGIAHGIESRRFPAWKNRLAGRDRAPQEGPGSTPDRKRTQTPSAARILLSNEIRNGAAAVSGYADGRQTTPNDGGVTTVHHKGAVILARNEPFHDRVAKESGERKPR
jgi:hypothetical protein